MRWVCRRDDFHAGVNLFLRETVGAKIPGLVGAKQWEIRAWKIRMREKNMKWGKTVLLRFWKEQLKWKATELRAKAKQQNYKWRKALCIARFKAQLDRTVLVQLHSCVEVVTGTDSLLTQVTVLERLLNIQLQNMFYNMFGFFLSLFTLVKCHSENMGIFLNSSICSTRCMIARRDS